MAAIKPVPVQPRAHAPACMHLYAIEQSAVTLHQPLKEDPVSYFGAMKSPADRGSSPTYV